MLQRTPQDIERYHRKNEITTKGRDVPPPMLEFYEGAFPDYAMREITKCGFEKPTAIQAQGKYRLHNPFFFFFVLFPTFISLFRAYLMR